MEEEDEPSSSSLSGGAVAGIVIGVIVGVLILVIVVVAAHTGSLCFKKNSGVANNDYESVKVKASDVEVV